MKLGLVGLVGLTLGLGGFSWQQLRQVEAAQALQ
jgi:hypothetical protein